MDKLMHQPHLTRRGLIKTALSGCLVTMMPVALAASSGGKINSWRQYGQSSWGQIHFHCMSPASRSTKTPLICIHPTPYSGAFYREFQTLLARDRVVLCPDTPGFGSSDAPSKPITIAEYARALNSALAALGYGAARTGQVDVLGFHTGCLIAAEMSLQHPDLVRRLVLPGIPFREGQEQADALARNAMPKAYFEDVDALAEHWKKQVEWQGHAVSKPRLLELFGEELRSGPDHWWAYQAVFSYPCAERFQQIKVPTLVVATGGDLFETSRAASRLILGAELIEKPELEAPLFNQHYAPMAKLVSSFLDQPESGA